MLKTAALIPARSGSKGIKDKNIQKLAGQPLINWSIAACKKSYLIDKIYISTDSKSYADLALSQGAEVLFFKTKRYI